MADLPKGAATADLLREAATADLPRGAATADLRRVAAMADRRRVAAMMLLREDTDHLREESTVLVTMVLRETMARAAASIL
jgi:hypothetical protein